MADPLTEMRNASEPLMFRNEYDPWSMPDDYTVWKMAPDYVKPLLPPHWQTQKAVHPFFSYFCGLYLLCVGIAATIGNSMVLKIFTSYKSLRTPANMLIVNLAISDLGIVWGLIPEACYNFLVAGGPWQFGYLGCQLHAFCGSLFGFSQIITLTFIAWDRYNVIVRGMTCKPLTYTKVSWWIFINWMWSLAWGISPWLGWGNHYVVDGMLGTCSYDNFDQGWNNSSFMGAMTAATAGHVVVIVGCYVYIVKAVFKHEEGLRDQAKKMNVSSLRNNAEQQAISAEFRAAKVACINCTVWVIAWTPFLINAMVGTWIDAAFINPIMSEIPILFAKTSSVYNPIIYALSHPKYKQCLKELYPWVCITVDTKKKGVAGDTESAVTDVTNSRSIT